MGDSADVVHWYHRLCLDKEVVLDDMQKLSREKSCDRPSGISFFKNEFPVLFDALYAVFGSIPSNSRLCEQIHGMLRHALQSAMGLNQTNAAFSYKTNVEYNLREQRRDLANASSKEKRGKTGE